MKDRRRHSDTGAHARTTVVRILALVVAGGMATMAYLSIRDGQMLDSLSQSTTAALGALIALIAKTETDPPPSDEPEPVEVVNRPESPVPVEVEEK